LSPSAGLAAAASEYHRDGSRVPDDIIEVRRKGEARMGEAIVRCGSRVLNDLEARTMFLESMIVEECEMDGRWELGGNWSDDCLNRELFSREKARR